VLRCPVCLAVNEDGTLFCDVCLADTAAEFPPWMTEAEWLACSDPWDLIYGTSPRSARKERLLGCICCRSIWHLFTDERSRLSVEAAEQWADGEVPDQVLAEMRIAAQKAQETVSRRVADEAPFEDRTRLEAVRAAIQVAELDKHEVCMAAHHARSAIKYSSSREKEQQLTPLIRDLVGNPFRPVTLNPVWQTATVTSLAQAIYDERAFDRMPILADALEDAGCTSAAILQHCRQPGEHCRGCWVVDLLLGKQ
jgi:hypothetical protein